MKNEVVARSFGISTVKDSGGEKWKYPRIKFSAQKWHGYVRIGWRWTAYSLHLSVWKDDLT